MILKIQNGNQNFDNVRSSTDIFEIIFCKHDDRARLEQSCENN